MLLHERYGENMRNYEYCIEMKYALMFLETYVDSHILHIFRASFFFILFRKNGMTYQDTILSFKRNILHAQGFDAENSEKSIYLLLRREQ